MSNPRVKVFDLLPAEAERAAKASLDAAFKVHTALGPRLLESVYETCLAYEIRKGGLTVDTQVAVPIHYDQLKLDTGLRLDLLVQKLVIIEVKAVAQMIPLYESQLMTYLKITGLRLGLLINFNVPHLRDGIQRVIL